jgi:plastocyanin
MRVKFVITVAASLVAFVALTTSCAREYWVAVPAPSATTVVEIDIVNDGFEPSTMRVSKGARVVWTNEDAVPHSVTSANGHFDAVLDPGETFTHRFDEFGSFSYTDGVGETAAHGAVTVNFGRVAVNR